jgi:glutamyl/glutaminyl-tRNA synthetase
LALLGWHPEKDREIFSLEEITTEFSLKRVQKGGAIFNLEKLDWLNSQYIIALKPEELVERLENFIPKTWLKNRKFLLSIAQIEKERTKKLTNFPKLVSFFFELPDYPVKLLIWEKTSKEDTLDNLQAVFSILKESAEDSRNKIMTLAASRGRGEIFWPLRVALSGQVASPGPLEIMGILGREESLERIETAIKKLLNE